MVYFFVVSKFVFTDIDDSQDSRGKEGTILFPLFYLHLHTNIQIFICYFACEMTTTKVYFQNLSSLCLLLTKKLLISPPISVYGQGNSAHFMKRADNLFSS